ncbi:unnamed protein product [Xylocopa violacea]|uniref:DUF4789 domain-containing protein n=1 Tax=Xylocopa violacea TaxID=135666 RepID=A0ABP1P8Q9_XYLVO
MKWIFLGFTLMTWNYIISCQDFVFPNAGHQTHYNNKHNSMTTQSSPVTKPNVQEGPSTPCPENMKRYPLDETSSTWICDCADKFLYFPSHNGCYEAYRQGPCKPMNYVVLLQNATEPTCVGNPCLVDGLVPYDNSCYPLKSTKRVCIINNEEGTVNVNDSTYELECAPLDLGFHVLIQVPKRRCPPGSRRNSLGMCREEIK